MNSFSNTRRCILGFILLHSILPITAEIRPFEIVMPPTEKYIHYTDGFIRGPGYIDVGDLQFETLSQAFVVDDENDDGTLRDLLSMASDEGVLETNVATQSQNDVDKRKLNDENETEDSFEIDIAAFQITKACAKQKNCDWTQFGVGARTPDGKLGWCCTLEAIFFGLCPNDKNGRLILQQDKFQGQTRALSIPKIGDTTTQFRHGRFEFRESARYVVVFANCDAYEGRDILVKGHSIWKSTHGYLPGERFGFMYFYIFLTIMYGALSLWFGLLMKKNKESRIPIEKWILMTMIMGLSEMFFRYSDYFLWNVRGTRPVLLQYSGITVGVLRRGVSRILLIMVSLGWGVIRDTLGSTLNSIIVLGAAYIGMSAIRDLMKEFAEDDLTTLSYAEEVKLFDTVTVFTFVVAAVDVIFILWILDALNGTMQYLENNSQLRKLQRYLRLRSILLVAILFATIWVVFSLVDNYDEVGIVREEHEWTVEAATEVNYLYILIGISILWRPNPNAREYAYIMELPASAGDGDGETDLELSGVVPSAMDDEEEDEPRTTNEAKGYQDHQSKFKIDDGEAA